MPSSWRFRWLFVAGALVCSQADALANEYRDYLFSHQGYVALSESDCANWERTIGQLSVLLALTVSDSLLIPSSVPQEYLESCIDGKIKFRVSASVALLATASFKPTLLARLSCGRGITVETQIEIKSKYSTIDFSKLSSACALVEPA